MPPSALFGGTYGVSFGGMPMGGALAMAPAAKQHKPAEGNARHFFMR
jgi:hypothetical protein